MNRIFFQNGEVDTDEFLQAINTTCLGKPYADLPNSFKVFIDSVFKTIDIDGTLVFHKLETIGFLQTPLVCNV